MSQQPPGNPTFTPPPPPEMGNEMYSRETLAMKAQEAANDAKNALIMSMVGMFCFGFILGVLAFRKANEALATINVYQVALDKRGVANAAKVIGILDVVFWAGGLVAKIALR